MLMDHRLGAGLDKITSGFQTIIGNTGLGRNGIPIFVSAAIIFIGFFSLYFGTPGSSRELGHTRALAWFFSQFFFLAALIVALQGSSLLFIRLVFGRYNANPITNLSVVRHCHVSWILGTLPAMLVRAPVYLFTLFNRI
jgi:hypothetical protein